MRKLIFDQFEFDSPDSEESLEIHVALKDTATARQFSSLHAFVAASVGPGGVGKHVNPVPFNDCASCSPVRDYLERYARINVPHPCDWKTFVLFQDDLEWDGIFETADTFIRYHWLSTA